MGSGRKEGGRESDKRLRGREESTAHYDGQSRV